MPEADVTQAYGSDTFTRDGRLPAHCCHVEPHGAGKNVKQLRDNGVTQQLASYSGFAIPAIASLPEAKGALFTTQKIDWNSDDAVTRRFTREYQTKTNRAPTAYAANYYNAVLLFGTLASALQKAGLPITGESLLAKRREIAAFDLVGGRLSFEKDGTIRSAMQINEVGGEPGVVETVAAP